MRTLFFTILLLVLNHSPLSAKGGGAVITEASYQIRDALNRAATNIKNQQFESARSELNSVVEKYGRSQEFLVYRKTHSELENNLNASIKAANATLSIRFDRIILSRRELGRSSLRQIRLPFSGTIFVDPNMPLEDALNQWLEDNRGELLKTVSINLYERLFVESVVFINREENSYQDSRRDSELLRTPAGKLWLTSTFSKMYVVAR